MARRLVLGLTLLIVIVAPAARNEQAQALSNEDRIQSLRSKIAAAQAEESRLASQIGLVEGQIRDLEARVGNVSNRLDTLEHELALHQARLEKIKRLFELQTERLNFLREQYGIALERLNRRLVDIYETEDVTTLDVILSSGSFSDVIEQLDYLRDLGSQDLRISHEVNRAKVQMRAERQKTAKTKQRVETITRTIAVRAAQARTVRDRLIANRQGLSRAKTTQAAKLLSVREEKQEFLREVAGLEAASNALAARLQSSGSSSYDSAPSSSGLIWPVSGPVVSGFGMRWGRMHTGIDIAVGYGTPIRASASGTVISAGWMGGYGNLVVIDHGGGLSTAYAHQSSMAVGGGSVSQGQVIGYVGCTGHCFGPHLHFEVRVNGSPVDPMGYL
jgi:murein DD-endopeptidase MepM/ murein hydrolase activator NlpD